MKPAPFLYDAPKDESALLDLLKTWGSEAKVLAGGQSLMPMLNMRLARPAAVIDLNRLGWDSIDMESDVLTLGALVRHEAILRHSGIRRRLSVMPQAVHHIGHPAIRNRGTVGGSLAHADPSAEHALLLLLLDGSVETLSPRGPRTVPAEDLFQTYFTTTLAPDEVIRRVRYRVPEPGSWGAFFEVAQTRGAFAIVACGALVRRGPEGNVLGGTLVLSGAAPIPLRYSVPCRLLERPLDVSGLRAWAQSLVAPLNPDQDARVDGETRRELAESAIVRVLREAAEGGGQP